VPKQENDVLLIILRRFGVHMILSPVIVIVGAVFKAAVEVNMYLALAGATIVVVCVLSLYSRYRKDPW
jgi:hypothetical protein